MSNAVDRYLNMLREDPDDRAAFDALSEHVSSADGTHVVRELELARGQHERRGEYQATAWLMQLEMTLLEPGDPFEVVLRTELSRIYREELMDDDQALGVLRPLANNGKADQAIAKQIASLEQAQQRWQQIADRFVEEARDSVDTQLKTSLLTRAASLYAQHGGQDGVRQAESFFGEALKADPSYARAARLYGAVLSRQDRWQEAADVCEQSATRAANTDESTGLWLSAARIHARKLGDRDQAAYCFQRALSVSPDNAEAMAFLVGYHTDSESWDEVVQVYDQALRARPDAETEQGMLLQIAMVHWRLREAPADAEPYFARLRKLDPAHRGVVEFYQQTLAPDDSRMLTILSDANRASERPEDKLHFARELAARASDSGELGRATEALQAVRALDSSDTGARDSLRAAYRDAGKFEDLATLVRAEIDALPKDAVQERLARLRELLPIYRDELEHDAMVANTLSAIVELDPSDLEALDALADYYENQERWSDLTRVVQAQAEAVPDKQKKVSLWTKAAGLWTDRFSNPDKAAAAMERAAQASVDDSQALIDLRSMYEKSRDWEGLLDVLKRQLARAEDSATKSARRLDIAQVLANRLNRPGEATEVLREYVERTAEPGADVLNELELLSRQHKDWPSLAIVLNRVIDASTEDAERIPLLLEYGNVAAQHLQDLPSAVESYSEVLRLEPGNKAATAALRLAHVKAKNWAALDALATHKADWESTAQALEQVADQHGDADRYIRAALLRQDKLRDRRGAVRSYELAFSLAPDRVDIIDALMPLYEAQQDWTNLSALIARKQHLAQTPQEGAHLLLELSRVQSERLGDPQAAYESALAAYELAPGDPAVMQRLQASAESASRLGDVIDRYQARLNAGQLAEADALQLRRTIAQLMSDAGPEGAKKQYEAILAHNPTDADAIAHLHALYVETADQAQLRSLLEHRVDHAADDEARVALLREHAELELSTFDDPQGAADQLGRVAALRPDDLAALRQRAQLLQQLKDWEPLADVVARLCELETDATDKQQAWVRLGDLKRLHLEDSPGAAAAYLEVLATNPADGAAVAGLEALRVHDADLKVSVQTALARAYEESKEFRKLAGVLRGQLATTTDEEQKRTLTLRLAEISGAELGDASSAYDALEAAFSETPTDASLLMRMAHAASSSGNEARMVGMLRAIFEHLADAERNKTRVARIVATTLDRSLGEPEQAVKYYRHVLGADPDDDDAFGALKQRYTDAEQWEELTTLYDGRIERTDDAQARLDLLLQLCFLFEEILERPIEATKSYERAHDLDPSHVPSRRALERLYREAGRFDDLARMLRVGIDDAEGHELVELNFELGQLSETELDDAEGAVDAYERVLEHSPTHLRAQEGLARMLDNPSVRHRAVATLEPIYESQGAWTELVHLLELQAEDLTDPVSKSTMLERIAELAESRLRDPRRAFDAVGRSVVIDPADNTHRETLSRLATELGSQQERIEVLRHALETDPDAYVATAIMAELAEAYDSQGNAAEAIASYDRLLTLESGDSELALQSVRALTRLHRQAGHPSAVRDNLRRQVELESDDATRTELLSELAELLDNEFGDRAGATEALRQRLDLLPDDVETATELSRLYQQQGQWSELIETLHVLRSHAAEPDSERALLARIASVYDQRLNDSERAIDAYTEIVDRFGADEPVLSALSRLFVGEERWPELLATLEQRLALTDDPAKRGPLQLELAEVLFRRTDDHERAYEIYAQLADDPEMREQAQEALGTMARVSDAPVATHAATLLAQEYENLGRHEDQVVALSRVGEVGEPPERVSALSKAARVAEQDLQDDERALQLQGLALAEAVGEPGVGEVYENFRRLSDKLGRWSEFVERASGIVDDVTDDHVRVQVLEDMADAALNKLGNEQQAQRHYEALEQARPDHAGAIDALLTMAEARQDHPAVARHLGSKIAIQEDRADKVALQLQLAKLHRDVLNDDDAAVLALQEATDTDPTAEQSYTELSALYRRLGRWEGLRSLYERQLDLGIGEPAPLHYALGVLAADRFDDNHEALEHQRSALRTDPQYEKSILAVEQMMDDPELRLAAVQTLEPAYLRSMRWSDVVTALRVQLDEAQDIETKKELLGRLAEVQEAHLEDLDGALGTYVSLFSLDPHARASADPLIRLSRVLGRYDELGRAYELALSHVEFDNADTAKLALSAGQLFEEKLGDQTKAIAFYTRAHRFDPSDEELADRLSNALEKAGDYKALHTFVTEREGFSTDPIQQVALLRRAAELEAAHLGDREAAVETYRRILELTPDDADAVATVGTLLSEQERYGELSDHLFWQIDRAQQVSQKHDLMVRLAHVFDVHLGERNRAIDLYDEVLRADPRDEKALAALEAVVADEDNTVRVATILDPVYAQLGQWPKRVAVLEALASHAHDSAEKTELLGTVAGLHEHNGQDQGRALNAWGRALAADPGEPRTKSELDRLAQSTGQWAQYVAALNTAASATDDIDLKIGLIQDVARTHDQHLGDPRAAIASYQQIVAIDPTADEVLDQLEWLQTMVGDWPGLIDVLEKKAERAPDSATRVGLLSQIGAAWDEQLGDVDRAIDVFQQVVDDDPNHLPGWQALDRLLESSGDPAGLAVVLEQRFEREPEPDTKIETALRLSTLQEQQLQDPDSAIALLRQVVELAPDHQEGLGRLSSLLTKQGYFSELVDVIRLQLSAAPDDEARVALLYQLGLVYERELDDEPRAIESFGQALSLQSMHQPSIDALKRITQLEEHREAAAAILEPHLRSHAQWSDLAELIGRQAAAAVDSHERSRHYVALADVHDEGRQDRMAVFDALVLALRNDPHGQDLADRLEAMADELGRHDELADALTVVARASIPPDLARDYDVRQAKIAETHLGDRGRAIQAYEHAIAEVGDDPELLGELDRLLVEEEQWEALHDVLERRLAIDSGDHGMWARLGRLRDERMDNSRGALVAFQHVVSADATHPEALAGLKALASKQDVAQDALDILEAAFEESGDPEALLGVFERRIEIATTDHAKLALLTRAADVAHKQAGLGDRAIGLLGQALCLAPSDAAILEQLESIATDADAWPSMVGVAEAAATTGNAEAAEAYGLYLRAADWYSTRLGDRSRAEVALGSAIGLNPKRNEAYVSKVLLLRDDSERAEELAKTLSSWAEIDDDPARRVRNLVAAATLFEDRLGDDERAAAALRDVITQQASHIEARQSLCRIAQRLNRFSEVAEQLDALAEHATDPVERAALHKRLASLLQSELDDPERAIEALQASRADAPDDVEVLDSLQDLYAQVGQHDLLRSLLLDRIADGGSDVSRYRLALSELYEGPLSAPDEAIAELEAVLDADPADTRALSGLQRLYTSQERWDRLITLLDSCAEAAASAGDVEGHREARERASKVHEKNLGDLLAAIESHQQVLALEPNAVISLRELARLHQAREDWGQATDALMRLSRNVDAEEATRIAERLTTIAKDHVDDPVQRQTTLEAALELDPSSERTRTELATHYQSVGNHGLLARLLEQDMNRASDPATKVELLGRLAQIHTDELDDPQSAARFLEQAVGLGASDRPTLLALSDHYIAAGQTGDAIPLLRQIAEGLGRQRSKEVADIHHRLGRALHAAGDVEGALKSYDAAFKIDLTNVAILRDLGQLTYEQGDLVRAQKSFRALLLQKLDGSAGITKADVYCYLGDIAAKQGDSRKAISMLERALAEDKTHARAAELLQPLKS